MASRNSPSITKSHDSPLSPSRACLCSPSTHPGSFRCSMHKKPPRPLPRSPSGSNPPQWHVKANSLKAILLQIIKPSTHDLHKRKTFNPKPTRFCLMNGNGDAVAVSWSQISSMISFLFYVLYVFIRGKLLFHFFLFSILHGMTTWGDEDICT